MGFQIGIIGFNGTNTEGAPGAGASIDWNKLLAEYQVQDCSGANVGEPLYALQTMVMNKATVKICNTSDIIGTYNDVQRDVLAPGQNITIDANTVHSISWKVVSGDGTLSINGALSSAIVAGEQEEYTASTLLTDSFTLACTSGKIVIISLKPAAPAL
jgi:hypothetical protein